MDITRWVMLIGTTRIKQFDVDLPWAGMTIYADQSRSFKILTEFCVTKLGRARNINLYKFLAEPDFEKVTRFSVQSLFSEPF
jgi:hypothetical protein